MEHHRIHSMIQVNTTSLIQETIQRNNLQNIVLEYFLKRLHSIEKHQAKVITKAIAEITHETLDLLCFLIKARQTPPCLKQNHIVILKTMGEHFNIIT